MKGVCHPHAFRRIKRLFKLQLCWGSGLCAPRCGGTLETGEKCRGYFYGRVPILPRSRIQEPYSRLLSPSWRSKGVWKDKVSSMLFPYSSFVTIGYYIISSLPNLDSVDYFFRILHKIVSPKP